MQILIITFFTLFFITSTVLLIYKFYQLTTNKDEAVIELYNNNTEVDSETARVKSVTARVKSVTARVKSVACIDRLSNTPTKTISTYEQYRNTIKSLQLP
jgi:uncharacterized protein YacL